MTIPESVRKEAEKIFFENVGFADTETKMIRAIALAILAAEKREREACSEVAKKIHNILGVHTHDCYEIRHAIASSIRNRTVAPNGND